VTHVCQPLWLNLLTSMYVLDKYLDRTLETQLLIESLKIFGASFVFNICSFHSSTVCTVCTSVLNIQNFMISHTEFKYAFCIILRINNHLFPYKALTGFFLYWRQWLL